MSNLFLRFLGWLSLAYVAVKVVTAYYLFMFAPSGNTAALEKLPALSPFDAIILLLATAAIAWASWPPGQRQVKRLKRGTVLERPVPSMRTEPTSAISLFGVERSLLAMPMWIS